MPLVTRPMAIFAVVVILFAGAVSAASAWAVISIAPQSVSSEAPIVGVDGEQGRPGLDGADGRDGRDGAEGVQGARGDRGQAGPEGARGANGLDGADGATGATGATGTVGPTGQTGTTGATGPAGPAGVDGEDADDYVFERVLGGVAVSTPGSSWVMGGTHEFSSGSYRLLLELTVYDNALCTVYVGSAQPISNVAFSGTTTHSVYFTPGAGSKSVDLHCSGNTLGATDDFVAGGHIEFREEAGF